MAKRKSFGTSWKTNRTWHRSRRHNSSLYLTSKEARLRRRTKRIEEETEAQLEYIKITF